MSRSRPALLGAVFVAASIFSIGCKSASSDSVVVVTAAGDLAGIRQLRAVTTLADGTPGSEWSFPSATSPQDLALPKSFSLRMPVGRSGRVAVRVTALSAAGAVIGDESTGEVSFDPGRVSVASVCFGQCPADAGVELDAHLDAEIDGARDSGSDGALDGVVDASVSDAGIDTATSDRAFDASAPDSAVDAAVDATLIDAAVDATLIDAAVDATLIDAAVDATLIDAAVDATLIDGVFSGDGAAPNYICPQSGWCTPPGLGSGGATARYGHSAVWTGTDMIVWGGITAGGSHLGFRWNPSSGAWTLLPQSGSIPSARSFHSAVWTGTEMILWGGKSQAVAQFNDGYRWDSNSGVWTPMVQNGRPAARSVHSAVWTGTEMVIWGGVGAGNVSLGDGHRWNPNTGTWTAMTNPVFSPPGRNGHTAVWTLTEMIVWGGSDDSQSLSNGYRWNSINDRWDGLGQTGNIPTPRKNHSAVWTGVEMVIWGGCRSTYFNDGFRWSPASESFTAIPSGSNLAGRCGHSAVWTGTEMLVWGGTGPNNPAFVDGAVWRP